MVRWAACGVLLASVAGCGGGSGTTTVTNVTTVEQQTTPTTPKRSFAQLVQTVRSGVIRIEAQNCGRSGDIGTGILLSPRIIATVGHVVAGAQTITLKRGKTILGSGTVLGEDPARDVAIVRSSQPITGHDFVLSSAPPRLGQAVAVLGFPLGLPLTVTRGSVSGLHRAVPIESIVRRGMVQTDAAVNPGNSGGPLLSTRTGDVLGLVDLGTTNANGLAFAVSSRVAGPLISAWRIAPQPVSAATCSSGGTSSGDSQASASVASYAGKDFSLAYPKAWHVQAAERNLGSYTDTIIADPTEPLRLVRVDITDGRPSTEASSEQIEAALENQPDYRRLAWRPTTIDGQAGLYWEFVVNENGVLLHKVDIFSTSPSGDGFAILTQAPAGEWSAESALFQAVRGSLTVY
jgi:S1-C subfamily serine protease